MQPVETVTDTEGPTPAAFDTSSTNQDRDVVSSVCHDLRGPLASIVTGAGFLRKTLPRDQAAALRVVEAIHRAANRLDELIGTFSDLARLEMHELTLVIRPEDVRAIMQHAFEQFLRDATAQGVPVSLELYPEMGTMELPCDRERLLQILQQLAACALRVVPEGGSITMRAGAEATGPIHFGIEARRRKSARSMLADLPKPELAIARGLIELHGGQLETVRDQDTLELSFRLA